MEVPALALAGTATALATGLGAVPVFLLGERADRLRPFLWGTTVGLMAAASVIGLLLPALDEDGGGTVAIGLLVGVSFLLGSRRLLEHRDVHVGELRGAGVRRALLVFGVLLVHSLPEGFAIGTAFASDTSGLALFVILAIALQNIPEGTSVAIPMESAGFGRGQQFWAAVLTSAPQPVGAVAAYLAVEQIAGLLPFSFAFAAGAMLALVVVELAPQAYGGGGRPAAVGGTLMGAAAMVALAAFLGVGQT
jgi:zinc transporter, ZIP family